MSRRMLNSSQPLSQTPPSAALKRYSVAKQRAAAGRTAIPNTPSSEAAASTAVRSRKMSALM